MGGRRGGATLRAIVSGVALVWGAAGAASAQALALEEGAWVAGGDAQVGLWDGGPALLIRAGQLDYPATDFGDGTLEFEFLVPEGRTFVGVRLRIGDDGTHENVYLRPHKTGLPDAVQYNPSFRGVGHWQLWHDARSTAFADFTPGSWMPVRIVMEGTRLAVFLGDDAMPVLVQSRLATARTGGPLGFWASQPGVAPDGPWTAVIRNVRVRPGVVEYDFGSVEADAAAPGTLLRWSLSEAWGASGPTDGRPLESPGGWRDVGTDPDGLLPVLRHVDAPGEGVPTVLARVTIRADRPRIVPFRLGFSDDATVFLNGRPLASGVNGYSYNLPRRDGLLTPDQMTVHLPLDAGDNELVVRVSDSFGGWGLLGRIADREGLDIRP